MPIILTKVSFNGYSDSNSTHAWYSHYNVFDGSEESFWESTSSCSLNNPVYVSYTWSLESFLVTRYKLYLAPSNRPIDWKFQGSNDLIVWDDLDLQVAQTSDRSEWSTFDTSNTQYYKSYRIICYAGASSTYPIRIYEMELWADEASITTSTSTTSSTSSSSSSETTLTSTLTTRTTSTTASTVRTTSTGPSLSISTTPPPDVERLWPIEQELSIVRNNFNEWYNNGIPLGVKRVDSLPMWFPEFAGAILCVATPNEIPPDLKYYLATNTGWERLNLGSVPHAEQHSSDMPDELIHVGPGVPVSDFTGKMWLDVPYELTTTTTTASTTTTTLTSTTALTSTLTTTVPSSTVSSTYTTTTTGSTTTASTTTLQNPVNVAVGGVTSADSWEIGFEGLKAYDGLSTTEWITNFYQDHFPHWLKYALKSAEIVHTYSIIWDFDRYAYSWYLEGSNNSYIWDTLDFIQSHEPLPGINYYHISNLSPYKYYRFRFMSGNDYRHSSIGIYNIELYAGGLTTTSTTTTESTTTTTLTSTLTTITTASSSTQLVYGFLSSGGIAVASDQYIGYPASNAFDTSPYTYWICDIVSGPPYWIMYYWPNTSYIVNKYNLHTYTLGRPKSWKLQGSTTGILWTDLDSQENISEEGDLEFIFNNAEFYSHYRFLISETHSTGYAVRVGNLELYGYRSELSTSTTTTATTTTTTTTTTTATTTETTASTTVYVPLQQKFLMNFNGANDSIITTDDTGRHDALVWSGNAKVKTEKSVYGSSSLYLPSAAYYPTQTSESYISVPNSYDWRLGGGRGNFSIDFWLFIEQHQFLWKNWNTVVSCVESIDTYWALRYYPEGDLLNFSLREDKSLLINYSARVGWSYGQWNHIALTRNGNTFKFYHNGEAVDDGMIYDIDIPEISGSLLIGKGPSEYLNTMLDFNQGSFWLDSLRIYLSSLFTGDFTVPSQPTTSTTNSSSSSTTAPQVINYTPKISLPCTDGGFALYDTSGRHGVATLSSDSTFTAEFNATPSQIINPLFGEVFFSSHKYPLDINNSEAGWVTFANHTDWRLSGANDFTIESWLVYKNTQYRYESPVLSYYQDASNFWFINIDCDERKLFFRLRVAGSLVINYSASINLQSLSWNYFALVRKQKRFKVFWNGEPCGEWSEINTTVIPFLETGLLYVFGGPSASNFNNIISSGIACNGLRISEGIVDGVEDGAIPNSRF